MTTTRLTYVAAAGQTEFDISFPYIEAAHVEAIVNNVATPFQWTNPSRIKFVVGLAAGSVVRINRKTPIDHALVTFQNGATLTEAELNNAVRQTLYIQQELSDLYAETLQRAKVRVGDSLGVITDPATIVAELVNMVLADELLAELRARIAELDIGAEAIIRVALNTNTINQTVTSGLVETRGVLTATNNTVGYLAGRVSEIVDDLLPEVGTTIQDLRTEMEDGDTLLASTLALVGAANAGRTAFVLSLATAMLSPTESLGERLEAIGATFDDVSALIAEEAQARATADAAEATLRSALATRVGTAEAAIVSEVSARSTAIQAEATARQALAARVTTAEAGLVSEATARASADAAEVTARQALAARVTTAEAGLVDEAAARASADAAEVTARQALAARVTTAEAGLVTEASTRANAVSAEAALREALAVRMGTAEGLITSNHTALVNADGVLTSSLNTLGGRVTTAEAAIVSEASTRTSAIAAEAALRTALATRVGTAEATITANYTTLTNADTAMSNLVALLGAKNGAGTAFILDTSKVEVGGGVSIGSRLSGIDTAISGVSASVIAETSARTTAVSAVASSVSAVTTTVGGLTSSVTSLITTTDGLSAKAGFALDVGGFVTGWVQNNNGSYGALNVVSSTFGIVAPDTGGARPTFQPFEYDAVEGLLKLKNIQVDGALIRNATIGTAQIGDLSVTNAKIGNLQVGTHNIQTTAVSKAYATSLASSSSLPSSGSRKNFLSLTITKDTDDSDVRLEFLMRPRPGNSWACRFIVGRFIDGVQSDMDSISWWVRDALIGGVWSCRMPVPYFRSFSGIPAGSHTFYVDCIGDETPSTGSFMETGSAFEAIEVKRGR